MHNYKIKDVAEMLKKEFGELKLFLKAQPVQYHDATIMGQFAKLHLEVHVESYYDFFCNKVKLRAPKPLFDLIIKTIFNREKQQQQSYSLIKKAEQHPKAIHIEVKSSQALEVILAIRAIIKIEKFSTFYKLKIYFSLQFDFNLNRHKQNEIK